MYNNIARNNNNNLSGRDGYDTPISIVALSLLFMELDDDDDSDDPFR
jgi:hypothetical protein